jgi:chitinase
MIRLAAVLLLTLAVVSVGRQSPAPQVALKVIGYYADWTANRYPLPQIPADRLTHVNYAFGKIGGDDRLTWNTVAGSTLFDQITELKKKFPHLKFLMSVGGWTDSGPFYEMAADDAKRRTFVESCASFLGSYPQFDGIDIDWEHPVAGGLQPGQPRDARNYVVLLAALRRAIGPATLLTVAVGAGPRAIDPLEYADMAASLDWINVMTYDFHSGGSRAGFNAALYNHDDPNPRLNVHDAVQAILAKGVPRRQLVVGVPFYGRGWRGVDSAEPWSPGTGTLQVGGYRNVVETLLKTPGYVRSWDDIAKVPWLYHAERKEWITYEDPQSMRLKGEYIAGQNLAGAMFWELSNDNGELLDALRAGLGRPGPGRP